MELKIGTDHADLDYYANQFAKYKSVPMSDPLCDPMEYAEQVVLANGTVLSQGWLQQNLHWAFMSEAQYTTMRGYIGSANILTRTNTGTTAEYTCLIIGPEREPEHRAGRVLDVTFTAIQLVAV